MHLHPASYETALVKKNKSNFKVSIAQPLACLVNQTLFCLVSQPGRPAGWLAGWLAGFLQRGPRRDNRRKENSHIHTHTQTTHTSKFQTVADGFNSLLSFFHILSGKLL